MKSVSSSGLCFRIFGLLCLFAVIVWSLVLHRPVLEPGYLNAGDDHIHVAFSNELNRTLDESGRVFGWSRLYGPGAPIFLLRPPGLYLATNLIQGIPGITIEQSLKIVIILGLSLFPLTMFIGGRLLGMGVNASVCSGILSLLPISLWGHTFDAYHYLGVHKQLLAILIFPIATGALWRLLKDGTCGLLFALSFACVFITHPYIAYCLVLLSPGMLLALLTAEPGWNWQKGLGWGMVWAVPAFLLICVWLIPFYMSPEIQVIDPYMSRRNDFDVVVCTLAETIRQFFLGGIMDTTRFAGPFGGTEWTPGNEWGWLDNSAAFRLPVLTYCAFFGLLITLLRPKNGMRAFLAVSFLLAVILLTGPDDFPFLDRLPFAQKFQNIHAIFLLEWVAILLGGLFCGRCLQWGFKHKKPLPRWSLCVLIIVLLGGASFTAFQERTRFCQKQIDVRNIYTQNGRLHIQRDIFPQWRHFNQVVQRLRQEDGPGNIAAFPLKHEDSVLYNLLPLMVDRSVFVCGFELIGGVYEHLVHRFRTALRDNYQLQQLFNIRYVVNSPFHRGVAMNWHEHTQAMYQGKFWELVKIKGDFGALQTLPRSLVGFVGAERSWSAFMEQWLQKVRSGDEALPWVVNLSHAGLQTRDVQALLPFLELMIQADGTPIPPAVSVVPLISLDSLQPKPIQQLKNNLRSHGFQPMHSPQAHALQLTPVRSQRGRVHSRVVNPGNTQPILFKRAFYCGWTARLDGRDIPIYRISPGLQMVLVPPGRHELQWQYAGPNRHTWAFGAFWTGLALCVIIPLLKPFLTFVRRLNTRKHNVLQET